MVLNHQLSKAGISIRMRHGENQNQLTLVQA